MFVGPGKPNIRQTEKEHYPLAASLIYRSLLDSIMERKKTMAYGYGAHYLKKLDALAEGISDWQGVPDHQAFMTEFRAQHGRKYSFWDRYDAKK